jgi:hypothetical protein
MDAMQTLVDYVIRSTEPYRVSDVVETQTMGNVTVTHVNVFPKAPELTPWVDVHFLKIGFTPDATKMSASEFYDMIEAASREGGVYTELSLQELQSGQSYITLDAWLGSQQLALQFLALGAMYKLWAVITPALLHIDDKEEADKLAGSGLVMASGLMKPEMTKAAN